MSPQGESLRSLELGLNSRVDQEEKDSWEIKPMLLLPYALQVKSPGPQGFGINFRPNEEEANSGKAQVSSLHLSVLQFGSH